MYGSNYVVRSVVDVNNALGSNMVAQRMTYTLNWKESTRIL